MRDRPYREVNVRDDLKRCALCGALWDECCGECQDWISVKKKANELRAMEKEEKDGNQD